MGVSPTSVSWEDPGHAGETMSLGWPGNASGVPLEELEEVSGVRDVWASLLSCSREEELDLKDFSGVDGTTTTTTKIPPKVVPKVPTGTKAPVKPKPKPAGDDFDLADALDPNNDIGVKDKNKGQGGGHPSGDRDRINQYDDNSGGFSSSLSVVFVQKCLPLFGCRALLCVCVFPETTEEVGTIAGIVSAVAMALVGAISSYISYQKKKLCFGIQQSLNTDMVKSENPEAVVATEPQGKLIFTFLL
ncbi:hypothetical protein L3Q82_017123 [Scortum barcoo]|uniref:Uncharacterized protein n=1 Tax=Scortum barcoo TaxID=214431 RepID=A0ACB8X9A0_9TELE|nr:hypothetical protein L3Q82_017123 [Scortum barcoo]